MSGTIALPRRPIWSTCTSVDCVARSISPTSRASSQAFAASGLPSVRRTEFFRTTWFRLGLAMAAVLVVGILALGGFVFWYISADLRAPLEIAIRTELKAVADPAHTD